MKSSIYILIVSLVLVARISYSQAIYKNASVFLTGKSSHAGKTTRIKLHQLIKKNTLEVKCNDTVFNYYKKDVFALTLMNLETSLNENSEFKKIIEIYFKNDNALIEYDSINRIFKIKRLLQISKL